MVFRTITRIDHRLVVLRFTSFLGTFQTMSTPLKRKAANAPTENESVDASPLKVKAKPSRPKKEAPPQYPLYDRVTMKPTPLPHNDSIKILSWNVAGLRSLIKKDADSLKTLVDAESADIVCLQEHKLQDGHCDDMTTQLSQGFKDWYIYWACSTQRKGYSGVSVLSKEKPLTVSYGIPNHDGEGRVIVAEYMSFYVVNVYVPNSGEGLKRLDYRINSWDKDFSDFLKALQEKKPLVVTGDLNVAHQEIDIHSPKTNLKSAGFTVEERTSFTENLLNGAHLVDAFRRQYPAVTAYTYWGYRFNARANNKGWRLDYFLVSESFYNEKVYDCYHMPEVTGSDHCPLGLVLRK